MSDELLSCPFCGGEAEYERKGDHRQSCIVVCVDCGARHESGDRDFYQGRSWNTRATDINVVTTPPVSESEGLQALDRTLAFVKNNGQGSETLFFCLDDLKIIRQALQRESVELESLNAQNVDWRVDSYEKGYGYGWNECIDHLLKNHTGKIIK